MNRTPTGYIIQLIFSAFPTMKWLVVGLVFISSLLIPGPAEGTHLIGGDLTYTRLNGNQFEVTLKLFRDCNTGQAGFDPTIDIGIFERNTHAIIDSATFFLSQTYPLSLSMPGSNCSPPPDVCGEAGIYTDIITLANNPNGYYIAWQRCCRNMGIINMVNGLNTGMVYYAEVPDPAIVNNSATFNYDPLPFVCEGFSFELDYSATDPDGDSLVYLLDEPLAGTLGHPLQPNPQAVLTAQIPGPYPLIEWTPGYSLSNVFNSIPSAAIDFETGLLTAKADQLGLYAIAFRVLEYRNGILISLTRREIEITAVVCDNLPPELETDSLPPGLTFHIYETDTLCFKAVYTDADSDDVEITFSGNVFGPGILPPFATATEDSSSVTVTSEFCWTTVCGHAATAPYIVLFNVSDNGCPLPASTLDTMRIIVHPIPQAGPMNLQCIGLVDDHTNRISWVDTSTAGNYIDRLEIFRSHNGGGYTLLTTITSDTADFFDDATAFNNAIENYCYYIIAVNKCGDTGPPSDTLCSEGQSNSKLNYIEYVTVKQDREIELRWENFPDAPWSTFYIYRAVNDGSGIYELIETLEQPVVQSWTDRNVSPDASSYCYYMLNRDLCGSISNQSNIACSILLEGTSEPWKNHLTWSDYHEWNGGVQRYEIFRKAGENGIYVPMFGTPDSILNIDDDQLEPNEGNYFYLVKAYEGPGGGEATSFSNEIELLQLPYIFLPNAFTPNRDLKNDRWVGYENFVKEISISIFNRWGQLVYSGEGLNAGWDGIYNGQDAPEGLYVYEVVFSGFGNQKKKTVRGTISLIR